MKIHEFGQNRDEAVVLAALKPELLEAELTRAMGRK